MYSQDKTDIALQVYHQCGSVTNTIRMLGYPTRRALYTWIENEGVQKPTRKALDNTNTAAHPRSPPIEVKMDAIHRCFELGKSIKCVSEEIGYSRASIYAWRKKYLQGGTVALMNDKNIKTGALTEGILDPPNAEMQQLLARMDGMQMEIDILKETINVLKKDPGINTETLKNREKAVNVDALKDKYPLPLLLGKLGLPKSSYYYQEAKRQRQDKYSNIRKKIFALFHENSGRYGYRRIHALLIREGITVSEKVVRRLMAEEGLVVLVKSRRKYNSYQGELSPSVPNTVNRDMLDWISIEFQLFITEPLYDSYCEFVHDKFDVTDSVSAKGYLRSITDFQNIDLQNIYSFPFLSFSLSLWLRNSKVTRMEREKYTKRIYNLPDKVYQFCIKLYVGESGHNSQYQVVLMCHAFNVSSVISNYYTLLIALSIVRIKQQISTSPYSIRFYLINGFR
uniref:IS3 family transposase n=1 Tax=Enterocloster clostridioformis TaxID=1531 RepID=UPI00267448DE|nr:IS3 family transposase [Enterocloster clostridioformis]